MARKKNFSNIGGVGDGGKSDRTGSGDGNGNGRRILNVLVA